MHFLEYEIRFQGVPYGCSSGAGGMGTNDWPSTVGEITRVPRDCKGGLTAHHVRAYIFVVAGATAAARMVAANLCNNLCNLLQSTRKIKLQHSTTCGETNFIASYAGIKHPSSLKLQ